MTEQKLTPGEMKEAADAIKAAVNIPYGKCAACYYNELIYNGTIAHVSPMPEHTCNGQKMSYEERLQLAAQKHADKWNRHGYLDSKGEAYLMAAPDEMLEEAETTVAAQAEAIRWALTLPYLDHVISPEFVERLLMEHGYIEPKPEEDGILH